MGDLQSVDIAKIIKFLEGLTPGDFGRIIVRLPGAYHHFASQDGHYERVCALVLYVHSSNGPGFNHVAHILEELFPDKGPFYTRSKEEHIVISRSSQRNRKSHRNIYTIRFEGTVDQLTLEQAKRLLCELMDLSGDSDIKVQRIDPGSVRFVLDGSREGVERLVALQESGELSERLGVTVQEVTREPPDTQEEDTNHAKSRLRHTQDLARILYGIVQYVHTVAHNLDLEFAPAVARAGDLARLVDLAVDLDLADNLAHALAHALARDLARTRDLAIVLQNALDSTLVIAYILDLDNDSGLVRHFTLKLTRDPYRYLARELALGHYRDRTDFELACDLALNLAYARVRVLERELSEESQSDAKVERQ